MDGSAVEQLAYLTAGVPGIGGRLKQRPADFVVDEVPLFQPAGAGDYLLVRAEKHRRLTTDVARFLAEHFDVPREAVGFAGLKDKHAITRQNFTIEGGDPDRAATFQNTHVRIVDVDRDERPLCRGKLKGNAFNIRIRDVDPSRVIHARRVLDTLVERGAPNYTGEQRFGYRRENHLLGRHLLRGEYRAFLDRMLGMPQETDKPKSKRARELYEQGELHAALEAWSKVHRFERQALGPLTRGAPPGDAVNGIDLTQRELLISSFQSEVFNRLLHQRVSAGTLSTLELGDLCFKHTTRGVFEVYDVDREQPRCDGHEISPTGPMPGWRCTQPGGEIAAREAAALAETGVTHADLAEGDYTAEGSRRALRMLVTHPDISAGVDEHGAYIRVGFELSRGCFATTVTREIMKPPPPAT